MVVNITNCFLKQRVEMMFIRKMVLLISFLWLCTNSNAQQSIFIDGLYEDWEFIEPIFVDAENDGQNNGIDIRRVWAINDQSNLYFRFELTKEIELQENNELALCLVVANLFAKSG